MSALVGFPLEDLEEMRDSLSESLDKGFAAIEEREKKGEDTTEYLAFWDTLMNDFEIVVEAIRRKM